MIVFDLVISNLNDWNSSFLIDYRISYTYLEMRKLWENCLEYRYGNFVNDFFWGDDLLSIGLFDDIFAVIFDLK